MKIKNENCHIFYSVKNHLSLLQTKDATIIKHEGQQDFALNKLQIEEFLFYLHLANLFSTNVKELSTFWRETSLDSFQLQINFKSWWSATLHTNKNV